MLLATDGYVKLCDFGIAKPSKNRETFVGTPDYIPPELALSQGDGQYGTPMDWWQLVGWCDSGCHFVQGHDGCHAVPGDERPREVCQYCQGMSACSPQKQVPKHKKIDATWFGLISGLLEKDPSVRKGGQEFEDFKDHPAFAGLDWEKLRAKELESPLLELLGSNSSQSQIKEENIIDSETEEYQDAYDLEPTST